MFDIRHNAQVTALTDIIREGRLLVRAGTEGKVITMRKEDDGQLGYLIKWRGRSGPVAVVRSQIQPT